MLDSIYQNSEFIGRLTAGKPLSGARFGGSVESSKYGDAKPHKDWIL
ncbi:hypothetical protein [Fortiea contorta]|nr:hypothetical protein [Fortiea contorta]